MLGRFLVSDACLAVAEGWKARLLCPWRSVTAIARAVRVMALCKMCRWPWVLGRLKSTWTTLEDSVLS